MTAYAANKKTDATANDLIRTPRSNRDLQQKLGGFKTITEGLDYAARGVTGFNFYSLGVAVVGSVVLLWVVKLIRS